MKRLSMIMVCLFAMMAAGTGLKAQEISILLRPGWNWIGYPYPETVDLENAFGDFEPMTDDVIESFWGYSEYVAGYGWFGGIDELKPGWGYLYYSNRTEAVTIFFSHPSTPVGSVTVTTSEPMLITAVSAMCGGEVSTTDGTYIIVKGLCWATHENPMTNEDFFQEADSGVGGFSASMTGLNISTTYYVRAYAVTPNGTVYGDQKVFTTRDGIPEVSIDSVTNILGNGATCYGTVTDNGGLEVAVCGVCWSTSPNPTLNDTILFYDFENGQIPSSWVNDPSYPWILSSNTPAGSYCIKSGNSGVTSSSSIIEMTVEFDDVGTISFDAFCQGEGASAQHYDKCQFFIDDIEMMNHGAEVFGWNSYRFPFSAGTHTFKWSYSKDFSVNPTGDAFSIDNIAFTGNGISMVVMDGSSSFSSSITCLNTSTTYYVRAYATTSAGTAYGEEVSFTTRNGIPIVTTTNVSNIQGTYALGGGNITDDGGLAITARGVCWSTSPSPTLANSHTTDGSGSGSFPSYMTGLSMNTTYYVRAYATNSFVTVYGNQLSLTTTYDEHAYVDLGLPSGTLWATCNVGADTPEDYGDYFAWGETAPKNVYSWSTYQYGDGSAFTKYTGSDGLTTLLPEDDATTANWGIDWRMPTKEEWQELYNNTTVTWTQYNGVNGRLFTASNGHNLFLPAAGERTNSSTLYFAGNHGYYWSSSLDMAQPDGAWCLKFYSDFCAVLNDVLRFGGFTVRPVRSSAQQ